MKNFELISYKSDQELANAAAADWLRELKSIPRQNYLVALSGGRIARHFFVAVANNIKEQVDALSPVHFFWADERCVPPNDPESNYRIANELMFQPLGIDKVHRIRGEVAPEKAAQAAETDLLQIAQKNNVGQPVFDLIILGMGEDGHVASLFPSETEQFARNPAIYRPVTAVKPPPQRITLGYPAIIAAAKVWVMASGAGKEEALSKSLAEGDTPLGRVIKSRSLTRILTDISI